MAYLTSGRDKIMGSSVSTDANVVTVIDATCTDEQVPSALATKAYVDNKEVKISTEENNKIEIKDDGIFVSKDYVEITQAEYDLLTEEEKKDIVFYITDATGNTELVTVIDENSTDEEIPSAKAVHTAIQNVSAGVPVNAYTKEEVDTLLDDKVNVDDLVESYSKDEIDTLLADKANATDTYNKTEIDALLDGKANTDDVTTNAYTKDEVDNLLANKADSSAIVDAYNKEEVDNLLTAKADATALDNYVLSDELDDYALTSSVYNKTEVDDLLTAKVNTTSVVTTLSSTNVDEEIPSAKAVYDAIQNVSAGVPADVYSKTEIDNLLDAKADTDAIIDAYNKTEVDDLLADKANTTDIVDAYTKDEVDNLLTNKADTDDIIDAYTKEEVNTLLDGKVSTDDVIDAYDKTEVDDLLTAKVNISSVVLTLSSANTDEEIPSAKAVYTYVDNKEVKISTEENNKIEIKDDGIFVSKDYVEITQAEYDLLTEEGKKDIVFYITDATGNTELVTVIDENSTDEEIPSAKAVHTAIQNLSGGVSTEQLEQAIQEAKTELENEITNVPKVTKTSELTNDSGYITASDIPEIDLTPYALKTEIPTTLPASDVHDWAKASTKPTYTASEVGALASNGTATNASKVANALTISLNGTSQGAYNGSAVKNINITAASVGASPNNGFATIAEAQAGTNNTKYMTPATVKAEIEYITSNGGISVVKSVQRGVSTIESGDSSCDIRITAVNVDKAMVNYLGFSADSNTTSSYHRDRGYIRLVDSTTVSISRGRSDSDFTFSWEVIEFN